MLDYATEPLLSGVYGGDASNLSAESVLPRFFRYERAYGSLIRGLRHERSQETPGQKRFFVVPRRHADPYRFSRLRECRFYGGDARGSHSSRKSRNRWLVKAGDNWTGRISLSWRARHMFAAGCLRAPNRRWPRSSLRFLTRQRFSSRLLTNGRSCGMRSMGLDFLFLGSSDEPSRPQLGSAQSSPPECRQTTAVLQGVYCRPRGGAASRCCHVRLG